MWRRDWSYSSRPPPTPGTRPLWRFLVCTAVTLPVQLYNCTAGRSVRVVKTDQYYIDPPSLLVVTNITVDCETLIESDMTKYYKQHELYDKYYLFLNIAINKTFCNNYKGIFLAWLCSLCFIHNGMLDTKNRTPPENKWNISLLKYLLVAWYDSLEAISPGQKM